MPGDNAHVTREFDMQPVPEHILLELGAATSGNAVMLDLNPGHHADTAQISDQRMILQRPDGIEEIALMSLARSNRPSSS